MSVNRTAPIRITGARITPVAFVDPPLLNTVGVHQPYALRAIIQLDTDAGLVGLGETYADTRQLARLNAAAEAITAEAIISIGSQPEFASALDNGLKMATTDMVEWLTRDYGMEPWAAHLLIGYQGRYDVVTVAGSMALRLPKDRLPRKVAAR